MANMRQWLSSAWGIIQQWRSGEGSSQAPTAPVLLPLTPTYDASEHGVYLAVLENALTDTAASVKNIALTGSYGVGKSSILAEVARQHQGGVIAISLSTLGLSDEPESVGSQASSTTNRIQKEIVKQLLYSQDPIKMPGSRYRRITRFRFWRELGLASLLSVPITVVFYLAGWTTSLSKLLPHSNALGAWLDLIVYVAVAALIFGLRRVFHNRIRIDKITAGAATISLSAQSATYFDEYLDEIVYFFEEVKRDIVIFEDIDRFDNAHIFETLRSLNTILNGAKQLRGRHIRFIYAIKDSIFDELGARAAHEELPAPGGDDAAEAEVARANRTKFFDLVIPVVPFITHRSARDLFVATFSDLDHNVSDALIDLASRYLADMRLIKNIRNEFAIFKQRVIDGGNLDLNQDSLLAMILYKNIHLSDFELIRFGKSDLDGLYRDGRELVAANIAARNADIRRLRQELRNISPAADRSQRLGDALIAHIARTFRHVNGTIIARIYAGNQVDDNYFRTPEFWESLASTGGSVQVNFQIAAYGYNYNTIPATFTRSDIAEALGEPISTQEWVGEHTTALNEQLRRAGIDRDFLAHADMTDLLSRPEFALERDGSVLSFKASAEGRLKSELAVQLLSAGYIDRNFTLYTSTFYANRVSANATNFLIKNVDPNVPDMYFVLEAEDVEAILRERTPAVLRERAAYNISVLDYLLDKDLPDARTLVDELTSYDAEQREFLLAYMESGAHKLTLARELARVWPHAFEFLIADAQLDEATRIELADAALRAMTSDVAYVVGEDVRDFIRLNYEQLAAFTSAEAASPTATIAQLLRQMGVLLPRLAPLSPDVLPAVVEVGAYEVTRDNLTVALGDRSQCLALDAICTASPAVYRRALGDLQAYLTALHDGETTVDDPGAFAGVIGDVLDAEPDAAQLSQLVASAGADCTVRALEDVATVAWPVLAECGRFQLTLENVDAYLEEFELDVHLAAFLTSAGRIEAQADAAEPVKQKVALAILQARAALPSPELRVKLAESLHLTQHIAAASIPAEEGKLIGDLLAADLVDDETATFARLASSDWVGREFAIQQSKRFASFMTPTEVPVQLVDRIMASDNIPSAVKDVLVDRFGEFTVEAPLRALEAVARYAVTANRGLPLEAVARLAAEGVRASLVVPLLQTHLASMDLSELAPILTNLGDDYSKLTEQNGKRPRLPMTEANRALVGRLHALGVVSSVDDVGGYIQVRMKRSPRFGIG
jgi:hypothetical protein